MFSNNTYDLFISHAWDYGEDYHRLIELLERQSSLDWRDRSVPRSAPVLASDSLGIREALAQRIYQANGVLLVAGMHLLTSKWVQYELRVATEFGKPIIGIKPPEPILESANIGEAATTMADWTTDSIAQAIRTYVE